MVNQNDGVKIALVDFPRVSRRDGGGPTASFRVSLLPFLFRLQRGFQLRGANRTCA